MNLRPGLSFSASKKRYAPAVKSLVFVGRYSSCTTFAFFSASLSRVIEAEHEARLRLCRIGFQRAGLVVDMRDLAILRSCDLAILRSCDLAMLISRAKEDVAPSVSAASASPIAAGAKNGIFIGESRGIRFDDDAASAVGRRFGGPDYRCGGQGIGPERRPPQFGMSPTSRQNARGCSSPA